MRIGCTKPGTKTATPLPLTPTLPTGLEQVREDAQGAIEVTVSPAVFEPGDEGLAFDVRLNTHSIDLSMDLAPLATLTTDAGVAVAATRWVAPRGGHHVSGELYFPAQAGGHPVLAGAQQFTLRIIRLDAPERIFTWTVG